MLELFFGNNAGWFTFPAIVGTFFFLLRLILMGVGGTSDVDAGGDVDFDGGVDVDADGGDSDADHSDSGDAFKMLSIQTIAAFVMGFGWAGLGAYKGSHIEWPMSLFIGAIGGIAMVWVLTLLLKLMYDLQSSGNINLKNALGSEGTVYVTIPDDGRKGQVQVVIDGRQRIYKAVTEGEAIPARRRVKVTCVNRDNTLTVTAI